MTRWGHSACQNALHSTAYGLHAKFEFTCLSGYLLSFSGRAAFGKMCKLTTEPEDVTVGFVVGKCIH